MNIDYVYEMFIERVKIAIPSEQVNNPIRSLSIFLQDKLCLELQIKEEEHFESPDVSIFTSSVLFKSAFSEETIAIFSHRGRKYSRNRATVLAIRRLNEDKELLTRYANNAFREIHQFIV